MKSRWLVRWLPFSLLAVMLICSGCATNKINWVERVGVYTYEQAVMEMGPPDKQAKLESGILVAEWLTRRGYSYMYSPYGYGFGPGYYGPYWYPYADVFTSPNAYVRLTFAADGYLQAWKRFYR